MKKLEISTYKANEDDVLSVYAMCNEDFSEEEAWDAVLAAGHENVEFIEFDKAVAQFSGYEYCAIFHEIAE